MGNINTAVLNATTLNGATFAAPGPIGSTTPSTGAFTMLSASTSLTVSAGGAAITGTSSVTGAFSVTGIANLGTGVVNFVAINGGLTTAAVTIKAAGETNVPMAISSKGNSATSLYTNDFGSLGLAITHTVSANQYPIATGTNGAGGVLDTSAGKLDLKSAGTSVLQLSIASAKSNVLLTAVPTSSAGLAAGTLYQGAANATFFA